MNYIQLFFNEEDSNGVYLDYYLFPRKGMDASYNQVCHFIDTEYIEYIKLRKNKGFNIHTYIENSIRNDYYLCVDLNEYYIPNRMAYKAFSYEHYNLLFGFDDEKNEYDLLGYDSNGKIVHNTISYHILENALCDGLFVRYRFTVNPYVFEFNIDYLKEIISEFVNGQNSSVRYANILTSKVGDYGIKVFDKLLNTHKGFQLFQEDRRLSYLLYEHAMLNSRRLNYLINEGFVCIDDMKKLKEKANEMMRTAEKVKNLVIKNSYKPQNSAIFENLTKLENIERDYFETLLECLR